jgi:hypothetical protein
MPENTVQDLEQKLATANASITELTQMNKELTSDLEGSNLRNKKLKRAARREGNSHQSQLVEAARTGKV